MSFGGEESDDSTQPELDRLLDSALALARQRLAAASDFEPFAIFADSNSRVMAMDWDTAPLGKHPEIQQILGAAVVALRHVRDDARCTALIVNTHLSKEKTDALEVRLEHCQGTSVVVFLPYKRAKFGNHVDFGDMKVYNGKQTVWA